MTPEFDYPTTVEIDRHLRDENDRALAVMASILCPAETSWGQLSDDAAPQRQQAEARAQEQRAQEQRTPKG